jgi:RNA polymerase sigma-70 factor (ECF subfamily)
MELIENSLIRQILNGATERYAELVQLHENAVFALIVRIVGSCEEAEELTQDVFLKAYSNLHKFKQHSSFSTWLYRIARNTAFDHLSKHDREKNNMPTTSLNDDITELKELPATMHNPEEDIIKQQEYDKWLTNIEKLKEDYKIVAKMNLIDNFGYKEIADALDMPINTVKTKIRRAKNQLLKMMDYSDELL